MSKQAPLRFPAEAKHAGSAPQLRGEGERSRISGWVRGPQPIHNDTKGERVVRAVDIVGKKVRRVHQRRRTTRIGPDGENKGPFAWEVESIEFEGGGRLLLGVEETDDLPLVCAWYRRSSLTRDQMMKEMLPGLNKLFGLPYEGLDDHEEPPQLEAFEERIPQRIDEVEGEGIKKE